MADMMTFTNTVEEFMEQYKITDTEHVYTNGTEMVPIFRMKQWFDHLPSAQPEQRWIPVTERLPEECGEYLVTKKYVGWNCTEYYRNDIAYLDTSFHKANDVVAWMPLPEPYKGE